MELNCLQKHGINAHRYKQLRSKSNWDTFHSSSGFVIEKLFLSLI